MPGHAADRVETGQMMPGTIVVPRRLSISQAIDELELIVTCSLPGEWDNTVRYLAM